MDDVQLIVFEANGQHTDIKLWLQKNRAIPVLLESVINIVIGNATSDFEEEIMVTATYLWFIKCPEVVSCKG